jgi:hypothetical protein
MQTGRRRRLDGLSAHCFITLIWAELSSGRRSGRLTDTLTLRNQEMPHCSTLIANIAGQELTGKATSFGQQRVARWAATTAAIPSPSEVRGSQLNSAAAREVSATTSMSSPGRGSSSLTTGLQIPAA